MAQDILDSLGDEWDADEHYDVTGEDINKIEYVQRTYPDIWKVWVEEGQNWIAQAFLSALNGDGSDLNIPPGESIWGHENTDNPIQPPFEFDWAETQAR